MQDPALAPDQGAANAKVGFEAWLSGLFEEDHTVSDADQTQDSKARRLSLGGTSAQIMRGNKIANGKLLRRRRELPAARQKQVVVANPYLDSEPTITTSRTNDTEDKASENLDKIRMRWDSQRKLSISTVRTDTCTLSTTANFSNYGYGSQYFPLSAKRPSPSHAPVTKAEAFTRLEPGSMLWPLIADSVGALCARSKIPCKSSSLWARTTLLPCVVVNLDVASKDGIPVDAAFDYCYSIHGSGDGLKAAYFERGAANENLIAAVDNIFPAKSSAGFPIAVAKRTHFRTREADLTVDRHYGHHASLVFLYSREHIYSEIERNAPGTLSIQAFQKARGARPWIVRALWDRKRKCRSVWILTSTSEYVQQPHEEATKVGQLWTKATSGQHNRSASGSSSGPPMDTRVVAGSLHAMHGRNLRSHHVHELATDMSSRDRCNIVQASPAVWPVPAKMIDELAEALRRISRLPLAELAADFCQDEQSGWHLLQVKAFKLEEEGIMSTEEAKRRSHGTLVPIVRPLVRPKRKRIVTRDQDPQATVKNTLRKCAGDLCGGKVAVSRSSKPVAKREIFLERASQRAWDEARALGTATRKPVYDTDELFAWLAEDEQKNQNQLVRVCETCYEGYRALAAIREEGKSHGTGQRSGSVTLAGKHSGGHAVHTGEKAQKACLRLYEQFEEQARKKTLGVAKAMLEVQAREAKQANERRRLRRKRRPKRQSTSIQDASSSRQLSREGIHDSIDEGVKHAHEVSDARWETDSEWSGISLCPGDRVRDTDLREGTVVEVHEADDTCTVQFDMERIEARVSVSVLSHADIPQDTEFLQLSAADLIGVGPLPPLKKKNQRRPRRLRHSRTKTNTRSRVRLDATGVVEKEVYLSSNQDEDGEDEEDLYHAGVDEENDDADNDDDDNDEKSEPENGDDADEIDPVTGVSKSFRDLFVTDDQVPASDADPEKSHTPLYYRHQLESEANNARLYGQGVHHMY